VKAAGKMMERIAARKGIGNLLAEGVKRASEAIGKTASDMAVYTMKGSTPRGHDHRARWAELFDTCLSNTSTLEASMGGFRTFLVHQPPLGDQFSHDELPKVMADFNGWHQFDDCLGMCRFNLLFKEAGDLIIEVLNASRTHKWLDVESLTNCVPSTCDMD